MSTPPALPPDAGAVYRRYLGALTLHSQASAKAADLGATDLYALNVLELAGPLTPGELGARTGLTTGPTTRLIDRLEQAGYVRRAPCAEDRRKVIVELAGKPAGLDEVVAPARARVGDIIRGYNPEQLAVLFDYFQRATTAYQDATEELRRRSAQSG